MYSLLCIVIYSQNIVLYKISLEIVVGYLWVVKSAETYGMKLLIWAAHPGHISET